MAFQAFKNALKMAAMGFKLSRATKRSAPKSATGISLLRGPGAVGGAAAVPPELAKMSGEQLQARIKELRRTLEESQRQSMEEQSSRIERAVNSPDTSDPAVAAAARELAAEEQALVDLKRRLQELDVDREAYRAEISAATLKSVQAAEAYGLSHDAAPIFTSTTSAASSSDSDSTSSSASDAASSPSASSEQSAVDRSLRESVEQVARDVTAETDQTEKNTVSKSPHSSS